MSLWSLCRLKGGVSVLPFCRTSCVLVLVCSAVMCAGMWLGDSYLAAALTNSTAVQQQLKLVLPVVVATIMRKCFKDNLQQQHPL